MSRRLAAILVADMVGYSRLMGIDEAGTLAQLREIRADLINPTVAANQGRIVKLMGDGMLAVFESVSGAVIATAEVQKAVWERESARPADKRISFRAGIHMGDLIADGDDVYGEGVNMAARLEALSPAGGICLSEDAWRQVKGKVDLSFEDMGLHELKNLEGLHRVYAVDLDPARLTPEAFSALTGEQLDLPDKPSVAVLPFDNMSGDPEQAFFADGITEDLLTTLSKLRDLVVIARNSTFAYKGRAVDVRQIGRELGVRYVLEGSVRKGGNRVRITAQLIDAQSGDHVWAERYDRTIDDIFAVQDEITREIAVALSVKLTQGDEARLWAVHTRNTASWEQLARALSEQMKFSAEANRESRRLSRAVLAAEPDNPMACLTLGWALMIAARYEFVDDAIAALEETEALATRIIALAPADGDGYALMSSVQLSRGQHEAAIASGEKAIELGPGIANNHGALALALSYAGRYDEALSRIRKAMRLSPYFPDWFLVPLGDSYRGTGQLEKAREVYGHFAARAPDSILSQARLACALAELGLTAKARGVAETVLSLAPDFKSSAFAARLPFKDQGEREKIIAGLRASGLPG